MTRTHRPPPPQLTVRLDRHVLVRDGGRLLCGGAPFRLVRLRGAGAQIANRWRAGAAVGDAAANARLARRLLDAGLLLTCSNPAAAPPGAIVVPARDRVRELRRCLCALARHYPAALVVVVDDGSTAAEQVAAIAETYGATLIRHQTPRGPGAARNTGLHASIAPLVAFVDSDVVVGPGCLERLASHFEDPAVGAAAPRVLALNPHSGRLARYDAAHSSLDMGPDAASAAPGRRVPYVPSTALVVRRDAVPDGGFDHDLHVGEDVDLVWRMHDDGWRVVYDPEATVRHDHRIRPAAFWRRRFDYARSIGPLARRHPSALPAMAADPWSAAIVGLLAWRRCGSATLIAAIRLAAIHRRLAARAEHPTALAGELLGRSLAGTARGAGHAIRRTWSPLLLLAGLRRRRAFTLLGLAFAGHVAERARDRPADAPLLIADDLVAAAGTWVGCIAARTLRPLLPR